MEHGTWDIAQSGGIMFDNFGTSPRVLLPRVARRRHSQIERKQGGQWAGDVACPLAYCAIVYIDPDSIFLQLFTVGWGREFDDVFQKNFHLC